MFNKDTLYRNTCQHTIVIIFTPRWDRDDRERIRGNCLALVIPEPNKMWTSSKLRSGPSIQHLLGIKNPRCITEGLSYKLKTTYQNLFILISFFFNDALSPAMSIIVDLHSSQQYLFSNTEPP